MKQLLFTLTIVVSSLFLINTCYCTTFSAEKATIDTYGPQTFKTQISDFCTYLQKVLTENADGRYDIETVIAVLTKCEDDTSEVSANQAQDTDFLVLYGGLKLLENIRNLDSSDALYVIEAAEITALLFSPELFKMDWKDVGDCPIRQGVLTNRNRLERAGRYFLGDYQNTHKKTLETRIFKGRRNNPTFGFFGRFYTPLIRMGDDAVYSEEAFLYALSKGFFLYGLEHRINNVHGGLYKYPAFLFGHDMAHHSEIIRPTICDDDALNKIAQTYVDLAAQLYSFVNDEQRFDASVKPRAVRAAFCMLHENRLFRSSNSTWFSK